MVERLGGRVVVIKRAHAEVPTLAIFPNGERSDCPSEVKQLRPRCRIVRERWLLRLEGLTELPDFRPDAVYARVGDVRDPRSYFYGAVPDRELVSQHDDNWKPIPEDWTPSAEATGAAT